MNTARLCLADVTRRREQVADMTRAGMTVPAIAECCGVTTRTVERDRRIMGVARSKAPPIAWTADVAARVEAMIADGCSQAEIARTVGCSRYTVWRRYRGRGWTRRQGGQHAAFMRRMKGVLDG